MVCGCRCGFWKKERIGEDLKEVEVWSFWSTVDASPIAFSDVIRKSTTIMLSKKGNKPSYWLKFLSIPENPNLIPPLCLSAHQIKFLIRIKQRVLLIYIANDETLQLILLLNRAVIFGAIKPSSLWVFLTAGTISYRATPWRRTRIDGETPPNSFQLSALHAAPIVWFHDTSLFARENRPVDLHFLDAQTILSVTTRQFEDGIRKRKCMVKQYYCKKSDPCFSRTLFVGSVECVQMKIFLRLHKCAELRLDILCVL